MAAAGVVLRADGLYVSRHGDAVALSPAFLKAVDPSVAVLSVGARNRDGLPARTTLDLLASVSIHRTDLHGTVELRSDGSHLTVVHERDPR
jgi:beta-lactamase superfamily II metal-dependent hydrolase